MTVAGVITFKAKAGQGDEVARNIAAALPYVEAEAGTPLWLVLRSSADADTVFLVDLFTDTAARDTHMAGEAAKLIFAVLPPLLETAPAVHPAEVIAAKLPASVPSLRRHLSVSGDRAS